MQDACTYTIHEVRQKPESSTALRPLTVNVRNKKRTHFDSSLPLEILPRVNFIQNIISTRGSNVLPNINRTQAAERVEKCRFIPSDLDRWRWNSNWSDRGTKNVFPVNLAKIRSAVPDIFHTQKSHRQRQKQNPTQFTARGKNRAPQWWTITEFSGLNHLRVTPVKGKWARRLRCNGVWHHLAFKPEEGQCQCVMDVVLS